MKSYQRKHLRSPFYESVLFVSDQHVLKARGLNISEGGILLDYIPHFPKEDEVDIMLSLPQLPLFKNFSLDKVLSFDPSLFKSKIIRLKSRLIRKIDSKETFESVFTAKVGLQFTTLSSQVKKNISEYVETSASNLMHMQLLMDSIEADKEHILKLKALCSIMGYDPQMKLAMLRKKLLSDYQSLQW